MSGPGTYVRTDEIRAKNRKSARGFGAQCDERCTCRKHRTQIGRPGRKCEPGCDCGRHHRTPQHNTRIGISVSLTAEAKRG